MTLSPEEMERVSRQILVRDFGGQGQARLKAAHIAIIGLGGVGSPLALYLAAAGLGQICIYEDDDVERSNLNRQILYGETDIGSTKSEAGTSRLKFQNPHAEFREMGRFIPATAIDADLWIDGTDLISTRRMVNQTAREMDVPLLSVSLAQWEGQIAYFHPKTKGCYHCLYPSADDGMLSNCSQAGVMGPVAGIMGTLAALEAIKILTGHHAMAASSLLLYDGLYQEMRKMVIGVQPDCPICG